MILIVGGAGQGKLEYVLGKTGLSREQVACSPEEAEQKRILYHLEQWVKEHEDAEETMKQLLQKNPSVIILCNEVGCGVVPVRPEERLWRERVGRLCCSLARRAERVERVFCGLPQVLKGEATWN